MKNKILSFVMVMAMILTQISAVTVFTDEPSVEDPTEIEDVQQEIVTLRPVDATYVSQYGEDANQNFHDSSVMMVNYTNRVGGTDTWGQYGYMKFDISDIDRESVKSATLRLYVEDNGDKRSSIRTIGIFETWDSEWDGSTITWANGKSEAKTELGSFTVTADGNSITDAGWREIDVTECLQNGIDSYVSLMAKMTSEVAYKVAITSGTYNGLPEDFDENVYNKNMPQLVIERYDAEIIPYYKTYISASQDTYVEQNSSNVNYSDNEYMKINYTSDESRSDYFGCYSYLDFNIPEINRESISSAKLWVYVDKESDNRYSTRTIGIFKPSSTWQPSMTWVNGRVATDGDAIGSFSVCGNGYYVVDPGWRCIDVTDYVRNISSNKASFMMKVTEGSAHPVLIRALEHSNESTRPQLVVTVSEPIESEFTDENFLNAVRELIGKTNNEHIFKSDVENIATLDISDKDIEDLQGIEYFTGLKELICYFNLFTTLDLSNNLNLETLDCSYNPDLTSINISKNVALKELNCQYSGLTSLDIRHNINLISLICYSCPIGTLDISFNTQLEFLNAYDMGLPMLDVSKNTKLTYLDCSYNQMRSEGDIIGLENCNLLNDDEFEFEPQLTGNDISELFVDEKFLEIVRDRIGKPTGEIYQSDVAEITEIQINGECLTSLDGIEQFRSLETLDVECNHLEELDLSSNIMLKSVNCAQNYLTNINVSNNTDLETIDVRTNMLTEFDVTRDVLLTDVDVTENYLTTLDLSNSQNLEKLYCSNNMLCKEELSLPRQTDISLFSVDIDSLDPVTHNGIELQFSPQGVISNDPTLRLDNISNISNGKLNVSGRTAKNLTIEIYDVTDITEYSFLNDETLKLSVDEDKEKIQYILAHEEMRIGTFTADAKGLFDVNLPFVGTSSVRKLVCIAKTQGDKGATAVVKFVDITDPYLQLFTFNNVVGTVNLLDTGIPLVKTMGYFNKKTTFVVDIANSENVNKVYINIHRDGIGYQYDLTVELQPVQNEPGKYMYYGLIRGLEGTTGGEFTEQHKQYGTITVSYTTNDESNETETQQMKKLIEKNVIYVNDPSGYIYEAVPSNRLSNVKTTLYYMDNDGGALEWDANEYSQINPLFTSAEGQYEWYVPSGIWKVKAELEGYETFYTDWMRVPPAQMDVNFGMSSNEKPTVAQILPYPEDIEIEFTKYMCVEDMTTDNIIVSLNGEPVNGTVELINPEIDYWEGLNNTELFGGTGNTYVSKIAFIPNVPFEIGDNVVISINTNVQSYSGVNMDETYEKNEVIEIKPTGISLNNSNMHLMGVGSDGYEICYGETENFEMKILPVEASKGKKLFLSSNCQWAASVPTEVIVDENGIATIPITGLLPGMVTINMLLEDSNLTETLDVNIVLEETSYNEEVFE